MKIKIISSDISAADLENKVAEWTNELKPKIISVNVNSNVLHDYYIETAPPMICNSWIEYICSIVYETN
ncbi:MAG: hypothetical protein HQ522_16200 [Bacteroidetes bacterium]|nr:hypothetical protein [Bacteroidota bacterium]